MTQLGWNDTKHGITCDTHHVPATSDLRTTELGRPPTTPQNSTEGRLAESKTCLG